VDPGLYQSLANYWTSKGLQVKNFVKEFPPAKYINPTDNKTLPSYLQNTTKQTGTPTVVPGN
jgi:hypothetical protein